MERRLTKILARIQCGFVQKEQMIEKRAFTLVEMLMVIAVIAILAALLLPVIDAAKAKAHRTACANNLHQINLGVHLYADEHDNVLTMVSTNMSADVFTDYKNWMKSYVGLHGASSPQDRLFACPADTFRYEDGGRMEYVPEGAHLQSNCNYSSYVFNAGNVRMDYPFTNAFPGIAGRKLTSIPHPAKTILVTEWPALEPYSWHQPQAIPAGQHGYNDARDVVSFVDGHVNYLKIYRDMSTTPNHFEAWHYDPPAGYDYQWSGD